MIQKRAAQVSGPFKFRENQGNFISVVFFAIGSSKLSCVGVFLFVCFRGNMMKQFKAVSVLLSAAMCMSMVMTPAAVMADEVSVPEETQAVEGTEKPAPKETEQQDAEPSQDEESEETEEPEVVEDKGEPEAEDKREAEDAYVAKGKCGKKVKWTLDKNGTLKITGKGKMKNYTYKDTGSVYTITAPWYKYNSIIRKVVISKGVTTVGAYAFGSCQSLLSVSLPSTIKAINTYAFGSCTNLGNITLPKKLKIIGASAFAGCRGMTSISIPKGVTSIGNGAFAHCYALKSIVIPQGVKSIEDYTFCECYGLESITIPSSVKKIGYHAFFISGLKNVNIPIAGLEYISHGAFSGSKDLKKIEIPLSVTYLGDGAFGGCTNLEDTTMSYSLGVLRSATAFDGCDKNTIHYYPYRATGDDFDDANGFGYVVTYPAIDGTGMVTLCTVPSDIASIKIPDVAEYNGVKYKVSSIASAAFKNHTALKSVVIGANVTTIDSQAFQGCSNLVSVTGGGKLATIGTRAFEKCHKLKTFKITSKSLKKIGPYAFSGDKALNTLTVKKTTKLTKSGVKKSLKGSSVKKVKVKKSKIKKYKKIFTKKNCGKKVKVKK